MIYTYPFTWYNTPYRQITMPADRDRGHFTRGGQDSMSMTIAVPWAAKTGTSYQGWATAIADFMGYTAWNNGQMDVNNNPIGWFTRTLPFAYHANVGQSIGGGQNAWFYVEAVDVAAGEPGAPVSVVAGQTTAPPSGTGIYIDGQSFAIYDEAILKLSFASRPYICLSDSAVTGTSLSADRPNVPDDRTCLRYVKGNYTDRAHYQSVQGNCLVWQTTPTQPMALAQVVFLAEGELQLTQYEIPCQGLNNFQSATLIGHSNSVPFGGPQFQFGTSLVDYFATETLVYVGSQRTDPYRMGNGQYAIDRTMRFAHYPNGANKFFKTTAPQQGQFVQALFAGSGARVFPLSDLRAVLDASPTG